MVGLRGGYGGGYTWKRRCPASSSPTKPPVMNFMKMGKYLTHPKATHQTSPEPARGTLSQAVYEGEKYLRNHGRFSRKRGDSAMQPG